MSVSDRIVERPNFLGGGNWRLTRLSRVNVVFGRNGTGKSLLLRALRGTDDAARHYVSPERGGGIEFDMVRVQTELDASQRANSRQDNFASDYREQAVARLQAVATRRGLLRRTCSAVWQSEVEEHISTLMPGFRLEIPERGEKGVPYHLSRADDGKAVTRARELSSGEAQVFTIGLDIMTMAVLWELDEVQDRLLLVDEPDLHLHPDLQQRFARFLVTASSRFEFQAIVATHSTTMLAALGHYGGQDTSVLYLREDREEQRAQRFDAYKQALTGVLGGHALMGPLFAVPILLVEGEDDYAAWSQAARYGKLSCAVIPCGGDSIKHYVRALDALLHAMRDPGEPIAYVLRDGDVAAQQTPGTSRVRRLQLNCREVENLYLTDEVLQLIGLSDWAEACELIRKGAANFGEKEALLLEVCQAERRDADLKQVMSALTAILDSKNVDWRLRIAAALRQGRPAGQLSDFLGEPLVEALWGAAEGQG